MRILPLGLQSWERTIRAVDRVRERLSRATAALEKAGIAYAVAGGNAVAAWVGRVDQAAVRFTQDVDLLIRLGCRACWILPMAELSREINLERKCPRGNRRERR
jgi:hypothetical protein